MNPGTQKIADEHVASLSLTDATLISKLSLWRAQQYARSLYPNEQPDFWSTLGSNLRDAAVKRVRTQT